MSCIEESELDVHQEQKPSTTTSESVPTPSRDNNNNNNRGHNKIPDETDSSSANETTNSPQFQSPKSTAALALSSLFQSCNAKRSLEIEEGKDSNAPPSPKISVAATAGPTFATCQTQEQSQKQQQQQPPLPPQTSMNNHHPPWAAPGVHGPPPAYPNMLQPNPRYSTPTNYHYHNPYFYAHPKQEAQAKQLKPPSLNHSTQQQQQKQQQQQQQLPHPYTNQTAMGQPWSSSHPPGAPVSAGTAPPPYDDGSHRMMMFVEATRKVAGYPSQSPAPGQQTPSSQQQQKQKQKQYYPPLQQQQQQLRMHPQGHPSQQIHSDSFKQSRTASTAGIVTPTPPPHKRAKMDTTTSIPKTTRSSSPLLSSTTRMVPLLPSCSSNMTASQYSRKTKSLGLLCENFMSTFGNYPPSHPTNSPRSSTKRSKAKQEATSRPVICIDEAAKALGVERRRIYDIINILESIRIVSRQRKNTYEWHGTEHLLEVFADLQTQAIQEYPEDAQQNGLQQSSTPLESSKNSTTTEPENSSSKTTTTTTTDKNSSTKPPRKEKSLGRLSQQFLQLFLVGHSVLSLTEASDKILGSSTTDELAAMAYNSGNALKPKTIQAAAARGLKTKIRRLYDIANVFMTLGFISKIGGATTSNGNNTKSKASSSKPTFTWTFRLSPHEIQQNLHDKIDDNILVNANKSGCADQETPQDSGDNDFSTTEHPQGGDSTSDISFEDLCENFINSFGASASSSPQEICIDKTAKKLGVERRRIQDIINILEPICIVSCQKKNKYEWHGTDHLVEIFGDLQNVAVKKFRQDAHYHGLSSSLQTTSSSVSSGKSISTETNDQQTSSFCKEQSLGRLSQQLLQLFLSGHKVLSITEASDKIMGQSTVDDQSTMGALNSNSNLEGPKSANTNMRRLHDIAIVFLTLGFLSKVTVHPPKQKQQGQMEHKMYKPTFMWSFRLSAQEIMQNALKEKLRHKDGNILANVNQNGAAVQQRKGTTSSDDKENIDSSNADLSEVFV